VASLSQGRTAAAQCGLFTHKSVPVIFEPPCISQDFFFHRTGDATHLTKLSPVQKERIFSVHQYT